MNRQACLNAIQKRLAHSKAAVHLALTVRNQCRCVIKYSLAQDHDPRSNGEEWLAHQIAPTAALFVDVGANKGDWSKLFLDLMPEAGKGLLFEPSENAAGKLHQAFLQSDRVEIVQAAVSDVIGQMTFYEEAEAGETSSLVSGFSQADATQKIVSVTTLDQELGQRQYTAVDMLKVDVEGYDLHVLRGAHHCLSHQQIGVIQFEYNRPWAFAGSTLAAAFQYLKSSGYEVFLLRPDCLQVFDYKRYEEYFEYSNFVALAPQWMNRMKAFIRR